MVFALSYQGDDRIAIVLADRARLPRPLQPLQEALTAVPNPAAPIPRTTPLRVFMRDLGLLASFGVAAGTGGMMIASASPLAIAAGLPIALLAGLGVTGRLRRLVVGHNHETGHGAVKNFYMTRGMSKKKARIIGEAIMDITSSLTLTMNGHDYLRFHSRHHRLNMLGTLHDPDGAKLASWGFWGNMKPGEFRGKVLRTIFSPAWHLKVFLARLRANFLRGKPCRRAISTLSLGLLAGSAFVMPVPAWIVAILIPWTWGYQSATLLQMLTRHSYPQAKGATTIEEYGARTWERIPWTPMPAPGLGRWERLKAWSRWSLTIIGVHLPSRLAVLDSSMVWHGHHHMAWPSAAPFDDWWNIAHRAIEARRAGLLVPAAASRVFFGLSEALRSQAAHMEQPVE